MTEEEWLACIEPVEMLELLHARASERQLRLFGCCCCHAIRSLLSDERSQRAVAVAERFADGDADKTELEEARRESREAVRYVTGLNYVSSHGRVLASYARTVAKRSAEAATEVAGKSVGKVAAAISSATLEAAAEAAGLEGGRQGQASLFGHLQFGADRAQQSTFLRDIFGNPFRPVTFSPSWRTSTAVALAGQMYESRDFSAMPILADALQDAGGDSADVLDHCCGPGPHVRGCWVVDLVLGKE
ncbi:Uncharacterized protein OS=Sorangium cellulosum (strain So ce56) GN=sce5710 PE=4 SV=1 [Gemmata massiliana]|uniref:Uncharacterized protein n=1 Tax=Gemmata massiliana TaxID=1210884 RepID=A0A6P2DD93_9BACT|nr:hypothetical protein [Gemmata massiliana]VTR97530.1 Uncharacterized protein OS=Sorangium cellulosum (strain So ce56) GN=sce5710 PE=4 SV=1 [Gemmata massiliana]